MRSQAGQARPISRLKSEDPAFVSLVLPPPSSKQRPVWQQRARARLGCQDGCRSAKPVDLGSKTHWAMDQNGTAWRERDPGTPPSHALCRKNTHADYLHAHTTHALVADGRISWHASHRYRGGRPATTDCLLAKRSTDAARTTHKKRKNNHPPPATLMR